MLLAFGEADVRDASERKPKCQSHFCARKQIFVRKLYGVCMYPIRWILLDKQNKTKKPKANGRWIGRMTKVGEG